MRQSRAWLSNYANGFNALENPENLRRHRFKRLFCAVAKEVKVEDRDAFIKDFITEEGKIGTNEQKAA